MYPTLILGLQNGNPGQRATIMSRQRILEVVLTMLGAVLLLIASVGKHPYGFYMVLRLIITVGAVYWAWRVYKAGQQPWTWAFVAVALLLNPFFPIRLQRAQWQPIDLCLGLLLIGWSGYWLFRKQTPTSSQNGQAHQTQWPVTEARTSAGGTGASTGTSAASPRESSSAIPKRISDPTPEWQMWIPEWPRPPWGKMVKNWLTLVGIVTVGRFLGLGHVVVDIKDIIGLLLATMMFWSKWERKCNWIVACIVCLVVGMMFRVGMMLLAGDSLFGAVLSARTWF